MFSEFVLFEYSDEGLKEIRNFCPVCGTCAFCLEWFCLGTAMSNRETRSIRVCTYLFLLEALRRIGR